MNRPPPKRPGEPGRIPWGGILGLCALTVLAYWPALRGGFVWDDDHFLTQNPLIRAADGLRRFWFSAEASDYWPVTSTSLWLEWRCWGMNPAGYHATNLVLHLGSALLLWAVLARLRIRGAFLAALVFAVHPVNVESVAWITQRKNLLAMVFFLGSLLAYLRMEPPSAQRNRWYALSLICFTLGMLSKGSIAMLPLVLGGVIVWRRRFTPADSLRLLPFALASAVLTGTNIWFQHHRSAEIVRAAGFPQRMLEAGAVAWFYLAKAVWPLHLSFCYPQWTLPPGALASWQPALAILAGAAALIRCGRRAEFAAFAYFAAMLVPVLGLTDVYFMRYALVADHYQHLAIIGVCALAATGWAQWRESARSALPASAATLAVVLCAALTWRQCGNYRDAVTLFQATLRENPNSWMAYNNLGTLLQEQGRTGEAIADYHQAMRIDPDLAEVHYNLANSLADSGRAPEAMAEYRRAIRLRPAFPEAYYCEGLVLARQGDLKAAVADYEQALRIRGNFPEARNDWGNLLLSQGSLPEAMEQFRLALKLRPGFAVARYNLGVALARSGQTLDAIGEFERAIALKPDYPEAENNLGAALAMSGRNPQAIVHYRKALALKPDYQEARFNLDLALKSIRP